MQVTVVVEIGVVNYNITIIDIVCVENRFKVRNTHVIITYIFAYTQ